MRLRAAYEDNRRLAYRYGVWVFCGHCLPEIIVGHALSVPLSESFPEGLWCDECGYELAEPDEEAV